MSSEPDTIEQIDAEDRLAVQVVSSRLISQLLVFVGNSLGQGDTDIELQLPRVHTERARKMFARSFNSMAGEFQQLEKLGLTQSMDFFTAAERLGIQKEDES